MRVQDTGSGVAGAEIEIQTSTGWRRLPTTLDKSAGIASATIPDDGSIPDGTYNLQALVWDLAGNEATITQNTAAMPEAVTLPLRIVTKLVVGPAQASVAAARRAPARAALRRASEVLGSPGDRRWLADPRTADRCHPTGDRVAEQCPSARSRPEPGGRFTYELPAGASRDRHVHLCGHCCPALERRRERRRRPRQGDDRRRAIGDRRPPARGSPGDSMAATSRPAGRSCSSNTGSGGTGRVGAVRATRTDERRGRGGASRSRSRAAPAATRICSERSSRVRVDGRSCRRRRTSSPAAFILEGAMGCERSASSGERAGGMQTPTDLEREFDQPLEVDRLGAVVDDA